MEEAISNKIIDRKRDNSITMIRVVSMFLIILTHFIREIEGIAFIATGHTPVLLPQDFPFYIVLLGGGYILASRFWDEALSTGKLEYELHKMAEEIYPNGMYPPEL